MAIENAIYTARAKAMGGRVGTAKSDDGQIDLKLDRPVEMGGKGNGTNSNVDRTRPRPGSRGRVAGI
jgi:organic hydroperoxide reductase OsmC/OhrA